MMLMPKDQLTGPIQQLPGPMAHLERNNGAVSVNHLEGPAATDRLLGDHGQGIWLLDTVVAYWWELLSESGAPLKGAHEAGFVGS